MKSSNRSKIFNRNKERPLRALQVEVTSRCTRSCSICPQFCLAQSWRGGDLDSSVWNMIEPDLHLAEHVHLQGWGEPLLNPLLPIWAKKAREAGCSVGITTNGDLLEEAKSWLLEGNVTLITISTAGTYRTHEQLRDGSKLYRVLSSVANLAADSHKKGLKTRFQLSYLLTKSNASELPKVVEHAAKAGLDEVYVTHLDCMTSETHSDHAAYDCDMISSEILNDIEIARKVARREGIVFRSPSQRAEEVISCALNPLNFVFISWDGKVGPCVNLLLPVEGPIPRWTYNGTTSVEPVVYGTLKESPLSDLLNSQKRLMFVEPFKRRLQAEERFISACNVEPSIRALREIDRADEQRTETLNSNPFPSACSACPKTHGW
ncbi:MAG: SPASM domain-containing protein [Spirochaetota bacterium]|nr:MAG: SPASM domain-containing protein [Spirochaetota bacterium]